ncbi:hypothetical protein HBH56_133430 [Parastagonospora nodorum]|uniref:DUF6594 domain-containing protein n=1 Tax=Phaeosphaeria nodorum (strain SN15 / ATCC MYA-4574 / FGSC 10173) TaxID=321614 RepID=A0A7U2FCK1_PHANO|nr:hypothetical protein HBH56_133430 [Parastagonospora nodorum]QRD02746.1 hypothetical protein JI435_114790 [Parastagonospora nodorum SN15]KAH3926886.1 hypothetical protein HBH54_159860 [Parastagonospora nodorum]KAH3949235.1 hypothetical protein HBH53_088510 [Parastagonospora nodorum]KAH3977829.1 hypothetical protein HBH51_067500 [Parastagonospora nodorum]
MPNAPQKTDFELGQLRDGYPALASWIAQDPDNETFIFRKFDKLAARNILHLQAQLFAIERELEDLDDDLRRSNDLEAHQSLRRWETLVEHGRDPNKKESKLVQKLQDLNALLKEYYETIVLQMQIASMRKPDKRPIAAFRNFLNGASPSNKAASAMPLISGRAKAFLEDEADLLTLTKPMEEDYLSRFLQDHWLFRKRSSTDPLDRTTIHKNSHVIRTVAALDMVLAAMLLIGAIVNLYLVPDSKAKLGLVAMYTLLFASSMALCTNARRPEVFAATAAYAAVLVVFVSGDLGGTKSEQCLIELEGGIWKTVRCPG